MVEQYDKSLTGIIISIVINLILGGIIGVAGALYDMFMIRGYVLENKAVFEEETL
jgi:hypothetical protein